MQPNHALGRRRASRPSFPSHFRKLLNLLRFSGQLDDEAKEVVEHFFALACFNEGVAEVAAGSAAGGAGEGKGHDDGVFDQVGDVKDEGAAPGFAVQQGQGEADAKSAERDAGVAVGDVVAVVEKAVADVFAGGVAAFAFFALKMVHFVGAGEVGVEGARPAPFGEQEVLGVFGVGDVGAEGVGVILREYDAGAFQVIVFFPLPLCIFKAQEQELFAFFQTLFIVKPEFDPSLHVFGGAVFALRREKSDVQRAKERRAAGAAEADHDVGGGKAAGGGVGDGGAFAEEQEGGVALGDVEEVVQGAVLRGVDDAFIHLHDAHMLQVKHVGALGEHDGTRVLLAFCFVARGLHHSGEDEVDGYGAVAGD